MPVIASGTVYATVEEFIDTLPNAANIRRYMRRFDRVPRKFHERGGRRRPK